MGNKLIEGDEDKKTYLIFIAKIVDNKCQYTIINKKGEDIGRLEKISIGHWMSWCLFLDPDCYMSAGCLDEVREKIRSLNSRVLRI